MAFGDLGKEAFDAILKYGFYGLQYGERGARFGLGLHAPKIDAELIEDLNESEAKNPKANEEIMRFKPQGVFFGKNYNKYVVKPENMDGHVLIVGTPGSGKSSCIAIPTLRCWNGSIFAIDVKGELYAKTHNYRRKIKVLEPQSESSSYYYDPYVFINESNNPAQEARAIAEAIIPLPPDIRDPFWIKSVQTLLTGAILHYHDSQYSFIDTLKNILRLTPRQVVEIVANSTNEKAEMCGKSFVGLNDETIGGIFAEMSNGISTLVLDNEIVRALTPKRGKKVISPLDLENGVDIYIKIPENLLRQWKNFFMLLVNQFITFFERRIERDTNRPILLMLDEFPRLGKIPAITDALATLRAKKITICLVIQSLGQLDMIYGREAQRVIADTCAYKAILGATDADTQEYFSKLVGTYKKIKISPNEDYDPITGTIRGRHVTAPPEKEPIIKPEEFANLRGIVLLHPSPRNFCMVKKQPFHETSALSAPYKMMIKKRPDYGVTVLGVEILCPPLSLHYNKIMRDLKIMDEYLFGNRTATIQKRSIWSSESDQIRIMKMKIIEVAKEFGRFDIGWLFRNDAQKYPRKRLLFKAINELAKEYNKHLAEYIEYQHQLKNRMVRF